MSRVTERRAALYDTAASQHGFFLRSQAVQCGYSDDALAYGVQNGDFERRAHGVYRYALFPSIPPLEEDATVALLLVRHPKAAISHETALTLHQIANITSEGIVHITVPRGVHPVVPRNIAVHSRVKPYNADEIVEVRGMRVVRPDIALIEAAQTLYDPSLLEQAAREIAEAGWPITKTSEDIRLRPVREQVRKALRL